MTATSLVDFQRRMSEDVRRPLTADEEMQTTLADGRTMSAEAERYVKANSRLSALERLELYNRQYWFRIIGAFQEDFPALQAVVGRKKFEALTIAYLDAHPSRSFTLRNLGSQLETWLGANPAMAGRRPALAIDTARVEWAYVEAFDGEDQAVLTAEDIAGLNESSRLALQPHVQLLELEYPVDDLVIAVHKGRVRAEAASQAMQGVAREPRHAIPQVPKRTTYLALHRFELSVYYKRLSAAEYAVLQALREGETLGAALALAFTAGAVEESEQAGLVGEWFHNWAELGWLCLPQNSASGKMDEKVKR
jgi:hypothetical protein